MAQESPGVEGQKPPESRGVTRRGFLREAAIGAGGVAAGAIGVSLLPRREQTPNPDNSISLDLLTKEQQEALQKRVWGGLTEVLQEGLFSKDSLSIKSITQIAHRKGGLLNREQEARTKIEGSLRGNSRQVGVHFSIDYGKEPVSPEEGLRLEILNAEGMESKTVVLGEQKGQILEMGWFTGENAGEIGFARRGEESSLYATTAASRIPMNLEDMKKRFEDMTEVLKKYTKIPPEIPFIPDEDFNGLHTFVNNRTGYGLLVDSVEGIDGKSVTFRMTEGLVTDDEPWRNIASIRYIQPKDISFKEMLKPAVRSVNDPKNLFRSIHNMEPPAQEYINELGKRYLSSEMVGEAKKG